MSADYLALLMCRDCVVFPHNIEPLLTKRTFVLSKKYEASAWIAAQYDNEDLNNWFRLHEDCMEGEPRTLVLVFSPGVQADLTSTLERITNAQRELRIAVSMLERTR